MTASKAGRASKPKQRCRWATHNEIDAVYHDAEWGVPSADDRYLFEMLILEGAQAGLSWTTILNKRAEYQRVYRGFDPKKVARFGAKQKAKLLENPGIVRNRLKVEASVDNAHAFLEVQREFGSFAAFLWAHVGGAPIQNRFRSLKQVPAETGLSRALSKTLKRRGFRFVGPTICYAYLQAVGVVNDHERNCFRHDEVARLGKRFRAPAPTPAAGAGAGAGAA